MNYAIPAPPVPTIAIDGTDELFPVRRIFCVGRNYADHAREMGKDPDREPPFFFTKPADAVVANGTDIPYPPATNNFHHEIELVVALGKAAVEASEDEALDHVFGYSVGIDLTRRDLQLAARDKGRPWDCGKAFDNSAPLSAIVPLTAVGHPESRAIWLSVNAEMRQEGNISQMIWSVPEIIAILSSQFRLEPGDLIFTGTPAGVGPLVAGDSVIGGVDGIGKLSISIV
jgi:fumarylpyruvate hydrolase